MKKLKALILISLLAFPLLAPPVSAQDEPPVTAAPSGPRQQPAGQEGGQEPATAPATRGQQSTVSASQRQQSTDPAARERRLANPTGREPQAAEQASREQQAAAARAFARLLSRQQAPYPPIDEAAIAPAAGEQDAEIEAAIRRYKETGDASIIKRSDRTIYPYDESQPVVLCSPLRACDVELQPGEVVTGVALGDSERWLASPLASGEPENPTPHVILKPREYDVTTNLVIATSRRTYHLGLHSPEKSEVTEGEVAYHRHVSFYYPAETVQQWARAEDLERRRASAAKPAHAVPLGGRAALDIADLNFDYSIKADKRATWRPTNVFDDGHHVYIELPPRAVASELPALLVKSADGRLGVANYRLNQRWYVVDALFRKAVLVRGVGKKRLKVEIVNQRLAGGRKG